MTTILLLGGISARLVEALTMVAGMTDEKSIVTHVIEREHADHMMLLKATEECYVWYEMQHCEGDYTQIKLPVAHREPSIMPISSAYFWDRSGQSNRANSQLPRILRTKYLLTDTSRPSMGGSLELA